MRPWATRAQPTGAVALLSLQLYGSLVRADFFRFDETRAPNAFSGKSVHTFYVYNHHDSPDPETEAFVEFQDMSFKSATKTDSETLHLSLIRLKHFWRVIRGNESCDSKGQLIYHLPPTDGEVDVYPYTVRRADTGGKWDLKKTIRTTGIYVLMISNCGSLENALVTGKVVVKNPFGFLPGTEYHKLVFYGWMCVLYAALGVVWVALFLRDQPGGSGVLGRLWSVQGCITVVIGLSLLEAIVWYGAYRGWNQSGELVSFHKGAGALVSAGKNASCVVLVCVSSMGWGVMRPFLDKADVQRIWLCCLLLIILNLGHAAAHRSGITALTSALQSAEYILCGGMMYWVLNSLMRLIDSVRDRSQIDKLQLFDSWFQVLVLTLSVHGVSSLAMLVWRRFDAEGFWRNHLSMVESLPRVLSALVLVAMMYLWAPHKDKQWHAHAAQASEKWAEADKGGDEGDDDDGDLWGSATMHKDAGEDADKDKGAA